MSFRKPSTKPREARAEIWVHCSRELELITKDADKLPTDIAVVGDGNIVRINVVFMPFK